MYNSSNANTILMDTEELGFVANFSGVGKTFNSLQMEVSNDTVYRGFANKLLSGTRGDLRSPLENLFPNISIIRLADDFLRPICSSAYSPPPLTDVTYNVYHHIYSYSASTRWAACGASIFFTVIALLIGLASMFLNSATFTNNFAAVFRVSKRAALSEELKEDEFDARHPLPAHLGKARLTIVLPEKLIKDDEASSTGAGEAQPLTAGTRLAAELKRKTWHTL